jgi:sugar/nucleoside kinase (ribokinase family)
VRGGEGAGVDVLCLGELMIDFIAEETGDLGSVTRFVRSAGGSAANVAAAVKKFEYAPAFIGKVGDDPFGRFLSEHIEALGIDGSHLFRDPERKTCIAFISLDKNRVPDYCFFREDSASTNLRIDEVEEEFIREGKIVYFSSISLTQEPMRTTTHGIASKAQAYGLDVVFDPNLRYGLWPSEKELREEIFRVLPAVTVLKINIEEWGFLWGDTHTTDSLFGIFEEYPGLILVAVTLGHDGSVLLNGEGEGMWFGPLDIPVMDTTGAGDAYSAALCASILSSGDRPGGMESHGLFASAAAELVIQKRGVIPALPDMADIEVFQKRAANSRIRKRFFAGNKIKIADLGKN